MNKDKMLVGFLVGVATMTIAKVASNYIIKNDTEENKIKNNGIYLAVHAGVGLAAGLVMNMLDTDNEVTEIED